MKPVTPRSTLAEWLDQATQRLQACGIDSARMDARILLGAITKLSVAQMIGDREGQLSSDDAFKLEQALLRRLAREPVSRILGEREFYGRVFRITDATLDPRPDSETLIDATLELVAKQGLADQPIRILDVGTGSGCLLLTLLAELPNATGLGTDISNAALEIARENTILLDSATDRTGERTDGQDVTASGPAHRPISERVEFRVADSLQMVNESFHFLISNPPYIPHDQIATLSPEVRSHDPHLALDGGTDGLAFYRNLATNLSRVISDGWALFEIGAGQVDDVSRILDQAGLPGDSGMRQVVRDLAGIERVIATRITSGEI